jgi:hypothetical protein
MPRLLSIAVAVALLCAQRSHAEDDPDVPAAPADETVLQALPKVPTLEKIGTTPKQIDAWVQGLIQKKEIKARVEVVLLKQRILAEQREAIAADKERIRREERYNASFGGPLRGGNAEAGGAKKNRAIKVKLAFQVPELDMYKRVLEAYKLRAALAAGAVETLTRIDRNADGKLSGDEYRDAGNLVLATRKLFRSLDTDNDGLISLAEIEAARQLPASGAEAISAGSQMKEANNGPDPLKDYDKKGTGELGLAELKALSSAYLVAALDAQKAVEHCQKVIDALATAQQASAAKFENLTIEVEEPQ